MAESHLEFTKPAHVVGRYALYGRLAAGGMATVHLGRMMELDGTSRTVAVKRLHPQFCKDPEFVAMFIDEARLAARIKHPNVVETLDILTMGQELLLVMEYIRGECFSKLLRAARRKNLEPSIRVVGHIASGMLHGLHAAHEAKDDRGEPLNVVHRDISPQNVMIDVDGGVKVLDFGVAKASARIQITRDGQMKGKLSYMSPEQLQGMPVDRRADVFACGVVLWEALTRRRLFVGEDASEVLRKILRDEVPRPSEFVPELTPDMDQVVLRALCKDPERRYQTAEELALDIENVIGLADPSDVTAWIYSVAGEVLTKRERLLEEIERLGSEGFPLPSADATGGSVHGSITDSDTFQRIQSWAEREAARAADLPSHPSLALDDDAAATVADTRVESGPLRPSQPGALQPGALQPGALQPGALQPGALQPGAWQPGPPMPSTALPPAAARLPVTPPSVPSWAQLPAPTASISRASAGAAGRDMAGVEGETLLDAEIEEEPTSRVSLPEPVAALAGLPSSVPVFSHAPRPESESAVRRKRRMLALFSAAGIFGVLTLVAVVAMQPVQLASSSGALRPEATAALRPEAAPALRSEGSQALRPEAPTALAANKAPAAAGSAPVVPAAVKESTAAQLERGVAARVAPERTGAERAADSRSEPPIARAVVPAVAPRTSEAAGSTPASPGANTDGLDEAAAKGVSLALSQAGKERQSAAAAKPRVARRTPPSPLPPPPRRARPAPRSAPPAVTPAASAASANKLDCKQPFWIDEKGIRRLKMACL